MEEHYAELRRLRDLRARSEQTTRWLDEMIAREETAIENMDALQRRAWIKKVNRGAVWAGTVGAAGALREAARESPGITAAVGGITVALGGGALALAVGIGGSHPPPVAGQRPSISASPVRPSIPPVAGPELPHRLDPRRPRVEPPRPVVVPVRARPVSGPPGGLPKVPAAPPVRSAPPPEMRQDPPAAVEPACVADVRVFVISARILCR